MKVMPSDHPQSLHSWPIFSVGDCFAPRPTQLPWGVCWVGCSLWAGAGLQGRPCGASTLGLRSHRPVTPEPGCVADRWASSRRQVKGSERSTLRGAADAHPHSYGKLRHTKAGPPPASQERETQPGQVTAATDNYHVQVSFTKGLGCRGAGSGGGGGRVLRFLAAGLSRKSSRASGHEGPTRHL